MTDDQFRQLRQLLLEIRAEMAAEKLARQKDREDMLRYHRAVMDALTHGPEEVDLPPDIEALFEAEEARAEERGKRFRS